jgi:Xaa-Pro aminopeptidase
VWPAAQDFGFPDEMSAFGLQFGHGLGLRIHERPIISRLVSLDQPMEIKTGMVFALETYCPATDGYSAARIEEEVVVTDKGCTRDLAVPGRGTADRQQILTTAGAASPAVGRRVDSARR